ncbi:hypothetical protein Ciccas_013089 [Cichlidogyrus casuarinus]|uniref:Uncharacterized protein n=1 Tax=Cichlidogyrus casuarinus TaxID=1844966 RepID=A0ABD2PPL1_9PLAT
MELENRFDMKTDQAPKNLSTFDESSILVFRPKSESTKKLIAPTQPQNFARPEPPQGTTSDEPKMRLVPPVQLASSQSAYIATEVDLDESSIHPFRPSSESTKKFSPMELETNQASTLDESSILVFRPNSESTKKLTPTSEPNFARPEPPKGITSDEPKMRLVPPVELASSQSVSKVDVVKCTENVMNTSSIQLFHPMSESTRNVKPSALEENSIFDFRPNYESTKKITALKSIVNTVQTQESSFSAFTPSCESTKKISTHSMGQPALKENNTDTYKLKKRVSFLPAQLGESTSNSTGSTLVPAENNEDSPTSKFLHGIFRDEPISPFSQLRNQFSL